MEKSRDEIFKRLGSRWYVKWQFLRDVYFLMQNDLRFSSGRSDFGIRYAKVSTHLNRDYRVEVSPRQLRYLVLLVKSNKQPKR